MTIRARVTWGPWEWALFKPDCLFCTEKATQAAKAAHKNVSVSIRCCTSAVCQALAKNMVKDHLRFMVGEEVEVEALN